MSRDICEHPDHEGDRLMDRQDLTERRVEWRTLFGQNRYRTRVVRRDCKPCADREADEANEDRSILVEAPRPRRGRAEQGKLM